MSDTMTIQDLARRVVEHPEFTLAITTAVAQVLEKIMRNEWGGDEIYIPKKGGRTYRDERNALIKSKYNGKNVKELATEHHMTVRQVRRIVGCAVPSADVSTLRK